MNEGYTDKARAIFLAALMVLSIAGGSIAFAGSAAAAASDLTVDSGAPAQAGDTITVSTGVSANGSDATFLVQDSEGTSLITNEAADSDGKLTVTDGGENDADSTEDGGVTVDLSLSEDAVGGEASVYASEGSDTTSGDAEESATFTIDNTPPEIDVGNATPGDGVVALSDDPIKVPISDAVSESGDLFITAEVNNNGNINTYKINPDSDGDDGVSFGTEDMDGDDSDEDRLLIQPGTGDVPLLEEGDVEVSVTAEDELGNTGTDGFSYEVNEEHINADLYIDNEPISTDNNPTNDTEEVIDVDLDAGPATIDDDSVELKIDGPSTDYNGDGDTFKNDSEQYNHTSDRFSLEPASADAVDAFNEDGEYTLTVTAKDNAGNVFKTGDSWTDTFVVDTEGPSVNGIEFTAGVDDGINNQDVDDNDEEVTVTFDDATSGEVDASTVEAEVVIDGEVVETIDDFHSDGDLTAVGSFDLSAEGYSDVTNKSEPKPYVNVTAAEDVAGNSLTNADADASQKTFAIDTEGPTVELGTVPNDGVLSGYVNVSSLIASTEDVDTKTVELRVGEESSAAVDITGDADDLDTRAFPDGEHELFIEVKDDSGNVDTDSVGFTLDNGESLTVNQSYLAGTYNSLDASSEDWSTEDYKLSVNGQFNLAEDVFEFSGDADVTYKIGDVGESLADVRDNDGIENDKNLNFDANDYDNDNNIWFVAEANGEEAAVLVTVDRIEVNSVEVRSGDKVVIESNQNDLSKITATVQDNDAYFKDATATLTEEDFSDAQYADGSYEYVADVPADLRDGQFNVTVDAVATETQTLKPGLTSNDFTIDSGTPTLQWSEVQTASEGGMTVLAFFDEPLDTVGDVEIEGVSDDKIHEVRSPRDHTYESGVVEIRLTEEIQTGDEPNVIFPEGTVTEAFGDDTNGDDEYTEILTEVIRVDDGMNVVSIPAVTGEVPIEDIKPWNADSVEDSVIETIWAYDDGEWSSYDPDADENSLTALEGGQGYIIKASGTGSLGVNAENLPSAVGDSETPQLPTEEDIEAGWNLIGHYQPGEQTQDEALNSIQESLNVVQAGYTGDVPAHLRPGQGYWVHADSADGYTYTPFGQVGPKVLNTELVEEGPVYDGDTVTVRVQVQPDEAPIDKVDVFNGELSIEGELSEVESDLQGVVYEGEFTAEFADDFSADDSPVDLGVHVEDQNQNVAYGHTEVDAAAGTEKKVTNLDTGVEYDTLTGALSEVKEFETLELSDGTFVENRDSLTITTDNLGLVGNGTEYTKIAANVELAGSDIHVEGIDYVSNSPTGDVTVTGEGTTLENVGSEGTISVDADSVTVSNSEAKTIEVNANSSSVTDSSADSVSVGADITGTSLSGVSSKTLDIDESADVELSGTTADNTVTIDGQGTTYDTIQQAVAEAEKGDVVNVGPGEYNGDRPIVTEVDDLTIEGAGADQTTIAASTDSKTLRTPHNDPISGLTVSGFTIEADNKAAVDVATGQENTDITFSQNTFEGTSDTGTTVFVGGNNENVNFENNTFTAADTVEKHLFLGGEASYGDASATSSANAYNVTNNEFDSYTSTAVEFEGQYGELADNSFTTDTSESVAIDIPGPVGTDFEANINLNNVLIEDNTFNPSDAADVKFVANDEGEVFGSIQAAVDADSDTIEVGAGTYDESVTIDVEGLTLEGAGADATTIDSTSGETIIISGADGVSISGLEVDGSGSSNNGAQGISIQNGGSATVTDTDITNAYGGIQTLSDGSSVTVDDIEVTSSVFGVGLQSDTNDVINDSTFEVSDQGIGINGDNVEVSNNKIIVDEALDTDDGVVFEQERGIDFLYKDGDNVTIEDNTIESTDTGILSQDTVTDVTITGNNIAGDEVHVDDQGENLDLNEVRKDNSFDPAGVVDGIQIIPEE